ncbi:hypothetical protein CAEBREN_10773 [Caenorhabditis brenneri]|uniref:Uncharacterized protein n=1 Tax=Caenorhabditis brenneri TaxID=135651 RepID=G0ND36_CAEBE|nr:hypothetical protein CAEBREN_10773 [Caenorhabditis brenneri]
MSHLAQGSEIPLKEQFKLAEKYCSENLMIQVCSSIKDAYELDEVVPKDLDSFCNKTKNIVLQRSFELLGIRKPSLPPQPEESEIVFEGLMGELLDQADLQNHHGMILADQAALLSNSLIFEEVLDREVPQAKPTILQDPRIHELMEELRDTHSPAERNAVRAQVLVVKYKNMYTTLIEMGAAPDHPLRESIMLMLDRLYIIIHRNQRKRFKPQPSVRGELLIDQIYRRTIETVEGRLANEAPQQNIGFEPIWLATINRTGQSLPWRPEVTLNIRQGISNLFRKVSGEASFLGLNFFVQNAREWFYLNLIRKMQKNQVQNQAEENMQVSFDKYLIKTNTENWMLRGFAKEC